MKFCRRHEKLMNTRIEIAWTDMGKGLKERREREIATCYIKLLVQNIIML